jgi:hypothetical protein
VVNLVMCGKGVWCSEKFCRSEKIFGPLKWYTDRNFFGDEGGGGGGGWRSPKLICSKKNFFGTCRAQSEKVGHISFRPPKFFLPVRPCTYVKSQPTLYRKSWVLRFPPTGNVDRVGWDYPPNWPFQRSCAPWSDMSHKVAAIGALRRPSTRSGWAASFIIQLSSQLQVRMISTPHSLTYLLKLLHMMNVRFSLLNMAQRILGVTLPNF